MVNHILAMQKNPKLQCDWHDIVRFFEEISNLFLDTAKSRSISFELDVDYSSLAPTPFVHIDQQKLRGICINLLGNALKFTPSGGTVRFSLSVKNAAGGESEGSRGSRGSGGSGVGGSVVLVFQVAGFFFFFCPYFGDVDVFIVLFILFCFVYLNLSFSLINCHNHNNHHRNS